ncbi:MAG: carboxypeptidase regulatory-like domain-containing protein, partial [bacterium]|nr:carboxypeptidase regulatory-like domain-containing protein [bacterium]
MQNRCALILITLVAVLLAGAPCAFGQTATMSGRVTDVSEAVIPATKITVTNVATNSVRTVETNEVG